MPRVRQKKNQTPVTDQTILDAYTSPGHPIAYSRPAAVAKYFGITQNKAKKLLQQLDSYNLHKEYKRPSTFNPYYARHLFRNCQADLIEMRGLSAHNDGVNYLLLIIDIFSRKIWVYPLQRKLGKKVAACLRKWLDSDLGAKKRRVKIFRTDGGKEFFNHHVRQVLLNHNITHELAVGTSKASYAERSNKSLQVLIYKHLTENETTRYIDVLPDLVKTYNTRGHRSLDGMSPNEASKLKNEVHVRGVLMKRYASIKRKKPTLTLGQTVRIKTDSKAISDARRAYAEQYHGALYTIVRINQKLPVPLYYLRSQDKGDFIEGGFYANELSPVEGNVFKVDQVLKTRGRGARKEYLIRWKWFGPEHDTWEPASNILRVY